MRLNQGSSNDSFRAQSGPSFLTPDPLEVVDAQEHLFAIAKTLAAFGQSLNAAIDQASAVDCSRMDIVPLEKAPGVDSQLWSLEFHLAATK
jgi:hypothetical protein